VFFDCPCVMCGISCGSFWDMNCNSQITSFGVSGFMISEFSTIVTPACHKL
jgi:hypothetical protein